MPYPVLPPEPPAMINSLPPEEHPSSVAVAATAIEPVSNESISQAVVVRTLTTPTPPETFAPENSFSDQPAEPTPPAISEETPVASSPQVLSPSGIESQAIESNTESAVVLGSPLAVDASGPDVLQTSAEPEAKSPPSSSHRQSDVHIDATAQV